ncbi:hypothetical protein [Ruminococcus sp.]|uniref:hypothetical protein n=1 Tax=Ruminococcus sp. TaxID=41978 RepID=UPI001B79D6F8|nr:hypothetical protein [Ruminococcus sp.]MBP5432166.1 hypothetical protein [Ruminococcus sp.]
MQSELQEIERAAVKSSPAPKDLRPPESMLYYMLLGLYAAYQAGKIDKSQGHLHKTQIYKIYNRMNDDYTQFTDICKLYQERIRKGVS